MRKPALNRKAQWLIALAGGLAALPLTNLVAGEGGPGGPVAYASISEQHVIKLQNAILEAERLEADGDRAMADGNYQVAVDRYREALNLIPFAPMSQAERSRLVSKYANACLKQADKLGKMGKFAEAETLLKSVLADDIDPDNRGAKTLLKRLQDSDYYNPAMTEKHYDNTESVRRHLKLGLGYFDLGQYNEAISEFNQVLAVDPYNVSARRLMEKTEREITNYHMASRDYTRSKMLREVDQLWETAVPQVVKVPVGMESKSGGGQTSVILFKLRNTLMDRVQFDEANIEEVVSYLRTKSVDLDPSQDKTGVNFILQGGEKSTPITLDLRNVPLLVALEQVCSLAGMKYRIESHAVFITSAIDDRGALESRVFIVSPTFMSSSGGGAAAPAAADDPFAAPPAGGGAAAASSMPARPTAKQVLIGMGANFDAPTSDATFLAGSSRLIVRNTIQQLDFIEQLIEADKLKGSKQVHITTKFVEVSQRNTEEFGFDWLIGAFNIGGGRVFGSGGTTGNSGPLASSDYPFLNPTGGANPVPVGVNPVTRGLRSGTNAISQNAIDGLLAQQLIGAGVSGMAPGIFALSGVFTDPQFQTVLRALAQKKGVDLLTAPSIVTRSGQRAKIEIIREFPYPTDFDPPQIPQDFGAVTFAQGGGAPGIPNATPASISSFPVTPTTPTAFTVRNTGVSMEVDPVIGEDGFTIDLNLAPEVVEFEGFINYGSPINTGAINALGIPTTVVLTENRIEQPVFATRKLTTAVTVWDGQTVGIGGLIREDVQMVEDKVPLLGDIPFFGKLFKSEAEEHFKKNLTIFVTAKLIDPAGNLIRTHREESTSSDLEGGSDLIPQPPPPGDVVPLK